MYIALFTLHYQGLLCIYLGAMHSIQTFTPCRHVNRQSLGMLVSAGCCNLGVKIAYYKFVWHSWGALISYGDTFSTQHRVFAIQYSLSKTHLFNP